MDKRFIIDCHFRGDQEQYEESQPELKAKAIKLLGPVLYYDLAPLAGKPLDC
jgi:hypothetical protein